MNGDVSIFDCNERRYEREQEGKPDMKKVPIEEMARLDGLAEN